MVSVDGFFAGADGNIDWHCVDDEFNAFAVPHTKSFGTLLFGRTTYQMFEDFWPIAEADPKTSGEDRQIARTINTVEKIVFSKTLNHVEEKEHWKNTKTEKDISRGKILELKNQPGKNIGVFGSGTIVQQLTNLGLIDEYRLMVNPVILGNGKPLFADVKNIRKLGLLKTRTFTNGNVLLYYRSLP